MNKINTDIIPDAGSEVPPRAGFVCRSIQLLGVPQNRRRVKNILIAICCILFCNSIASAQTTITIKTPAELISALNHLTDSTIIRFTGGTYFFSKPIQIPRASNVVFEADPQNQVILSAGQLVTNWKPSTINNHPCWSAYLPEVRLGIFDFRELWVNGQRATRARFPTKGYLSAVQPADKTASWNQGQTWLGFKPGDLPDELPADAEAIVMNRWVESRLPIVSVDEINHRLNSSRKTSFQLQDGDPYYLEGASQWAGNPGDWYLDHHTGLLYYLPREGEAIEKTMAIVPTHHRILEMQRGTNITFRGLTFSHSEWNLPEPVPGQDPVVGGFGQAEIGVPAAVTLQGCRGCQFESCTFQHLGNYALELAEGCRDNTINRCSFNDLGCGAIKIGNVNMPKTTAADTCNNTVSDCTISDGGHLFPSAIGIWVGQSHDNTIEHNEIRDLFYTAISIGWTWGYDESAAHGNRVDSNLIHHIGKKSDDEPPILSDMGAVYLLGVREGTVISNNVFHDIAARVYGGWGIYLDEGSSDVLIEKNLVYRSTHGGFHLHYGKNNTLRNNIFAYGRDVQIARTTSDAGDHLSFKNNIVVWNSGVFTQTDSLGLIFDDNLYHCDGNGKLSFGDKSWVEWDRAGQDLHSIQADPMFTNPPADDFSLLPGSPAEKIHFQPLQIAAVGPRH